MRSAAALTRSTLAARLAVALLLAGCAAGDTSAVTPAGGSAEAATTAAVDGAAGSAAERACIDAANPGASLAEDAPSRIGVKHILVRHVDSERAAASITRSRGQACLRAEEALGKLKQGEDFAAMVASYSDEQGAASRDGSLGEIRQGDAEPAFAAAAFSLEYGQISYIVETKFGFHIILRDN